LKTVFKYFEYFTKRLNFIYLYVMSLHIYYVWPICVIANYVVINCAIGMMVMCVSVTRLLQKTPFWWFWNFDCIFETCVISQVKWFRNVQHCQNPGSTCEHMLCNCYDASGLIWIGVTCCTLMTLLTYFHILD